MFQEILGLLQMFLVVLKTCLRIITRVTQRKEKGCIQWAVQLKTTGNDIHE